MPRCLACNLRSSKHARACVHCGVTLAQAKRVKASNRRANGRGWIDLLLTALAFAAMAGVCIASFYHEPVLIRLRLRLFDYLFA